MLTLFSLMRQAPSRTIATSICSQLRFSTTRGCRDLGQFFEDEKFRGEDKIRVGRSWRKDELRLKNNIDLHKLWYVLLKERNMLLTMEDAYKEEYVAMPNPERIDKVEESMENLEDVVRERNRAYYELEVGITGERDRFIRRDGLGRLVYYKPVEHSIPATVNSSYRKQLKLRYSCQMNEHVEKFLSEYGEKINIQQRRRELYQMKQAAKVVRRFPEVNMDALLEKFPLVDPDRLLRWKRIRGHNVANQDV